MEEVTHHIDLEEHLSPLALGVTSSPMSLSNSSSSEANIDGFILDQSTDNARLQCLRDNVHSLISSDSDDIFSDVLFYVSGCVVPLHRCILAVRCPFFKSLFTKDATYLASLSPVDEPANTDSSPKLKIDFGRLFDTWPSVGKVSYEAFMTTMGFIYSGTQAVSAVKCIDDECSHEACGPVVDFAIDMLGLSSVLDITDLKTFWQNCLHNLLGRALVDEVLRILIAAKLHGADCLLPMSLHLIAVSNVGSVDLEKQLLQELANEVLALRRSMGLLQADNLNPVHEKECKRIRKALDSNDVELVHLLLKEGCVNLDEAHALHYSVSYCDPHTVQDIMEQGLADVHLRNDRGFTALHVASMRRNPSILVSLLSKGANPLDTTPDGRTALQLCSRLMKRTNNRVNDKAANWQNDCLCVEILYQAGSKDLFEDASAVFPPTQDERELFMRLLYLENRMAVARLLFPQEAKLVTEIFNLQSTSEFVGFSIPNLLNMSKSEANVDLDQSPSSHTPTNKDSMCSSSVPVPVMSEALLRRIETLQKSAMLGRRMFPRISAILNTFTDDEDHLELSKMQNGNPKEQKIKKRRYRELKKALEEAFQKDLAAMERHKPKRANSSST
eukprot:c2495_g1_i1 orf=121-1965(-)